MPARFAAMRVFNTLLGLLVGSSPILFFMLLFNWLRRSAKKLTPSHEGTSITFYVSPAMRILLWIVLFLLIAFIVLVFVTSLSRGGDGWYGVFIPLAVLLAILLAMPRRVTVDHLGIRQHRWIGGDREIAWNEIAWMRQGSNTGVTYVKSKNGGRPVSFSPLLVGQSRFEHEVRARATHCNDLSDS
jgi:hypothetical protein